MPHAMTLAALLTVLLAVTLGSACGGRGGPPDSALPAPPEECLPLYAGAEVSRPLSSGGHYRLGLSAAEDRVVELVAAAPGLDLVLLVSAPGEQPYAIADRRSGGEGEERLALALRGGAVYGLEVHARASPRGAGESTLRVETVRRPLPADWQRAAVDRAFAAGEALRAHGDRDHARRAVERYREALARAEGLGETRRQAEITHRLGQIYRQTLEDPRQALGYYERALTLTETLGETGGETQPRASLLNNLGRLHFDLGEVEAAVARWHQALELAGRLGDRSGEASALGNLALASRRLGQVQQALDFYDRSLATFAGLGERRYLGRSFNNRGRFYQALGQPGQALADLERALEIGVELGDVRMQATALTGIGQIREQAGDLEQALEALRRALRLREEVGEERGRAVTLRSLGRVYEQLGRGELAHDTVIEALAIFRRLEALREIAGSLAAMGRLAAAAGEPGEAVALQTEALPIFRRLRDADGEIGALWDRARAERARGDPLTALRLTEEALDGVEALRGRAASHDLRRSYRARRQGLYDFEIDLLMELDRQHPGQGYDRRALVASERSRARSLLELVEESRQARQRLRDPGLAAREHELRRGLSLLEEQRLELLDRRAPGEQTAALEARLDALLRELRAVEGRIRAADPKLTALAPPRILDAGEIQTDVLDAGTLLLEIHLGADASFLWVVAPDALASFELPPREEIEGAARRAHELLRVSHQRRYRVAADAALAELGRRVLEPAADLLGDKRLLIAAEGALGAVPFAALPVPATGAASGAAPLPLVAEHEVVHIPSASALAALRRRQARRRPPPGLLAVIADPVFDRSDPRLGATPAPPPPRGTAEPLGRLPYSGEEARALVELAGGGRTVEALGLAATREAAVDPSLGGFRYLHLATHGVIDGERPELSHLIFSRFDARGRSRPSDLYAHELFDLELAADLVVLSGCETALGREIRGEGLVGLTQGFFHAGAAAVLVSLWRVDDRATAELMARFYRELLRDGRSPAAALRRAQLDLRGETGWQAPYFWAGFVLQGEPGPAAARRGDPGDEAGDATGD